MIQLPIVTIAALLIAEALVIFVFTWFAALVLIDPMPPLDINAATDSDDA